MTRRITLLLCIGTAMSAVRVQAQCPDGSPPPCAGAHASAPAAQSVAVLPFENRARDTSLTVLGEGVADEITTNLSRVARLRVVSPASVRYALSTGARNPRRIGVALGSRWLVDGQVIASNGVVRVNAQLLEAATGTMRWSGSLQRAGQDLLGLIRFIADSVATSIVGALAPSERAQAAPRPTSSPEAYESYLRGRAALAEGAGPNLLVARALFEHALRLDSQFAPAHAALASTWVSIADNVLAPRDAYPFARASASRALRIDSANGEATAVMAKVSLWYDWDAAGGLLLARRAVALAPRSAEGHLILGFSLVLQRDTAEALRELVEAMDLDSLSIRTLTNGVVGLLFLGRQDLAISRARRYQAAGLGTLGDQLLMSAWMFGGDCASAIALRDRHREWPRSQQTRCRGWTAAQAESALVAVRGVRPYTRALWFVPAFLDARQPDRAIDLLQQALRDREGFMPFIQFSPELRPLFDDPRFQELVRRVASSTGAP